MYDYLVGYARRDMSPTQPAPLAGYGDTSRRMHKLLIDPICATALAVTDRDGTTVLLLSTDMSITRSEHLQPVRDAIREKLDIPEDHIFIAATHTHSAPCQLNHEIPYMAEFMENYTRQLTAAALAAYEDRKAAELYYSSTVAEGLNFVRHYLHEDGTYSGPGFGTSKTPMVDHAYGPDPELRLIRFQREGAKDILLMNWQAHGTMVSYRTPERKFLCSADYITGLRTYLENEERDLIFLQGAAGDLMPTSDIASENPTSDIYHYGKLLGQIALTALENEKKAEAGPIRVKELVFEGKVDHSDDHMVEKAQQVADLIAKNGSNAGSTPLAQSLGMISRHHAQSILRRSRLGETQGLGCSVLQIGNIGVAVSSNELFSDTGVAIREGSPFDMTIIMGYCNGHGGYLPSRRAYSYFSYEVGCSNFAEGTAEEYAVFMKEQLTNLKNQ